MSGEGGMVGGVLVSRGFGGGITLLIQNHPPSAESPSRCRITLRVQNRPPGVGLSAGNRLLLAMCFKLAESPSGCGRIYN